MKRRGLILSVLALGVAGFGGAAWYATRPDPIAASDPTLFPDPRARGCARNHR